MSLGLVYVFTGNGKGKTSAAIGTAVRAVGAGMRVGWVAWYKQDSWRLAEVDMMKKLGVRVWLMGKGFKMNGKSKIATLKNGGVVVDKASGEEHKQAAAAALSRAKELVGKVDVLVLDEIHNAVKDGLIKLIDLTNLISKRGETHLILTGRNVHKKVVEMADLVTECRKVKHPYDKGVEAFKGLDF